MNPKIRIDIGRLKNELLELGSIGRDKAGGISRPSFSPADLKAREWFKDKILAAGLILRQDGAGNLFGRLDGQGACVMAGSHLDTVINGGMFDGSVGVLSALECLRVIKETGQPVVKPLEVAAFTDEEGNLVGDFLGSRAFLAQPDEDLLSTGITAYGVPFKDVLNETEFTVESIRLAHTQRPDIEAFLEVHIEQGPVLETEGTSVGIVDRIAGKNYWMGCFEGEASHAGTTPIELRHDAFLGLADFALKGTHLVATQHYGSYFTIGRVSVHPGSFSIVPGRVDFTMDSRSVSLEILGRMAQELMATAEDIASTRGLTFHSQLVDSTEPILIPSRIVSLLEDVSGELGHPTLKMPSGAGHDAQILSGVTDVGMIFIPCEDGISHSPAEKIDWTDLEKGTNLLLHALVRLAS